MIGGPRYLAAVHSQSAVGGLNLAVLVRARSVSAAISLLAEAKRQARPESLGWEGGATRVRVGAHLAKLMSADCSCPLRTFF